MYVEGNIHEQRQIWELEWMGRMSNSCKEQNETARLASASGHLPWGGLVQGTLPLLVHAFVYTWVLRQVSKSNLCSIYFHSNNVWPLLQGCSWDYKVSNSHPFLILFILMMMYAHLLLLARLTVAVEMHLSVNNDECLCSRALNKLFSYHRVHKWSCRLCIITRKSVHKHTLCGGSTWPEISCFTLTDICCHFIRGKPVESNVFSCCWSCSIPYFLLTFICTSAWAEQKN